MALLETGHETDEELALKIDALKTELDEAEDAYKEQMVQETRLQKMELDAISHLQSARNELKIAQLKSGKK
jgi:anti-sigma-K factor RskA